MSVNPVFHARSKHIEMDYHFVREKVAVGALITRYMPTAIQVADIFTKALRKYPFIKFRSNLGVVSIPHSTLRGMIRKPSYVKVMTIKIVKVMIIKIFKETILLFLRRYPGDPKNSRH